MNIRIGTAILVLVTGCSDSTQMLELQRTVEALQAENQELRAEQEAIRTSLETVDQLKGLTTEFETLRKDWATFERGFEASLRDELQKNVEAAAAALQSISSAKEASASLLAELEKAAAAVAELKELCVQHEAEAKKLNTIGQLQQSLTDMEAKLTQATGRVQRVESDVRRAQSTADDARTKAMFRH